MENYLNEAFKRLSLLEDDFNIGKDSDKIDELKSFIADDVEVPEEEVVDVNAETEADLADTYEGKIILDCNCCHSRLFKDEADVVIDDESNTANIEDICPVCNQSLGFTVIGKIGEFVPTEEAEEEKPEAEEADYDKSEDDIEDEEAFPEDDIDTEDEADEIEESCLKEDEEFNLPDPWGKDSKIEEDANDDTLLNHLLKLSTEYNLGESVEITADDEDLVNVVKNDDGTMEISVGAEDEKSEETFEEIVPLTDEEKDELSTVAEEPSEEEPAEESGDEATNESLNESSTPIMMSKALKKAVEKLADDTMEEIMADDMAFADEFVNNIWDPENGIETADQFYDLVDDLDYDSDDTILMNQVFEYAANYIQSKYSGKNVVKESLGKKLSVKLKKAVEKMADENGVESKEQFYDLVDDLGYDSKDNKLTEAVLTHAVNYIRDKHSSKKVVKESLGKVLSFKLKKAAEKMADENGVKSKDQFYDLVYDLGYDSNDTKLTEAVLAHATNYLQNKHSSKKVIKESFEKELPVKLKKAVEKMADENGVESKDQFYDLVDDLGYDADDETLMNNVFEYAANHVQGKHSDIDGDVEDLNFDDFDEDRFDDMAESFLRKTYSNVKGYSTKTISETNDSLIIEGVINYTNGKSRNTKFVFTEARVTKRGKLIFEGYNNTFSNSRRSFILSGKFTDKNFIGESLTYNYSVKKLNESTNKNEVLRVSGRIKYSK